MADRRTNLSSLVSDVGQLLSLGQSDLAYLLLSCLLSLNQDDLNLHNLITAQEFTRGYPPDFQDQINSSVSGAWSWLLGQGYLGQRPGRPGLDWVIITPQGRRWFEGEQRRKNAQDELWQPSAATPFTPVSALGLSDVKMVSPSEALIVFLARLVTTGRHTRDFDFTFSSILTLFLYSSDPVSLWFQAYASELSLHLDPIIDRSGITQETLNYLRSDRRSYDGMFGELISRETPTWSASAKALMENASRIAERTATNRNSILEPRHVMAAYVYARIGHEKQLQSWGLNQQDWGSAFYQWTLSQYPDESTSWLGLHQETFHRPPFAQPPPAPPADSKTDSPTPIEYSLGNTGPSTHVARDKWTIDDSLGYYPYAYAIYRFLTDEETAPPLAISIQAPWGGRENLADAHDSEATGPGQSCLRKE